VGVRPQSKAGGVPNRVHPGGIHAPAALLPHGWAHEVDIEWDARGRIRSIRPRASGTRFPKADGPVVCGMPNLHSHAFQRLLVGRTQDTVPEDDFWTWRHRMYQIVSRLTLDTLEAASAWLFAELVASGYTSVVEFHYVHRPGEAAPEQAADRILAAARTAGIRLTLTPVLYRWAGFDGSPVSGDQRAFELSPPEYADLFRFLKSRVRDDSRTAVGIAPHSLRAVNLEDLHFLVEQAAPDTPIHIHLSEQIGEVDDCLRHRQATPIDWLMDQVSVDSRWGLVHCTQATDAELARIASSGAVTVLCPTTEYDLGDGRFPAEQHLKANWGIGSDSQVSVSPMEELRSVLYGMRAAQRKRGVISGSHSAGSALWQAAARGKEAVVGQSVGSLEPGYAADFVCLDASSPLFVGLDPDRMLSALTLSGDAGDISQVIVGGKVVARRGRHMRHDSIAKAWKRAVSDLGV
jgi:formimidoylglutamate deiminase